MNNNEFYDYFMSLHDPHHQSTTAAGGMGKQIRREQKRVSSIKLPNATHENQNYPVQYTSVNGRSTHLEKDHPRLAKVVGFLGAIWAYISIAIRVGGIILLTGIGLVVLHKSVGNEVFLKIIIYVGIFIAFILALWLVAKILQWFFSTVIGKAVIWVSLVVGVLLLIGRFSAL